MSRHRSRGSFAAAAAASAAALVAALVASACSPAPSPTPTSKAVLESGTPGPSASGPSLGETFDPSATAMPVPFGGLYVTDELSVSGDATVAVVRSALGCAALAHILGAGEWAIVGREVGASGSGPDSAAITMLALQNGDETALAWLGGGATCTARIARTTNAPLRVSGAATFDGTAALDQPICLANGKSVNLGVVYRTPTGLGIVVSLTVPVRLGLARLDPDEVSLALGRGAPGISDLGGAFLASLRGTTDKSFAETYAPVDGSRLTLDVHSTNPLTGTLHLGDLDGSRGSFTLDGEVACHLPGGALDRAAEAAAGAGPTPAATAGAGSTSAPAATLAPLPGVASATVVAKGGAVAGTYPMPARSLDCYYDVDSGAWTIETVGNANPIFYLYLFMPEGPGSTDRASMGLVVGDGSNGRLSTFDSSISPPVGQVQATVAVAGGQLTVTVEGRRSDGGTLAANLSCPAT